MKFGWWCEVLSTEGHKHCGWKHCECPCHLPVGKTEMRRPHGYERAKWNRLGESARARVIQHRRIGRRPRDELAA
jgi:hypothetical protein